MDMTGHMAIHALRLVAAGYLLVLAGTALAGVHRTVVTYPFHAGYSALRLIVMTLTAGRVRLEKDVRRARIRNERRVRDLRGGLSDWRERRAEERALARGENPYPTTSSWSSSAVPAPEPPPAYASDEPPALY